MKAQGIGKLMVVGGILKTFSLACAAPAVPPSSVAISLTTHAGRDLLSIRLQEAPLHVVLSAVATQAGFELLELVPIEQTVSAICYRAPLDQALSQILQNSGVNFVLVYQGKDRAKLKQAIVLGTPARKRDGPAPAISALPDEGECLTGAPSATWNDTLTPQHLGELNEVGGDGSLADLLEQTTHWDPQVRATAIETLSQHGTDARARKQVMESVHDPDPYVRSIAIGTLGPVMTEWPGAEETLLAALGDPEPSVRRHALVILGEKAGPRATEALTLALQDSDPEIRAQAREFLQLDPPSGEAE
jgi:HEAT repeat protein